MINNVPAIWKIKNLMKDTDMEGTCSLPDKELKYIQNFSQETWSKETF